VQRGITPVPFSVGLRRGHKGSALLWQHLIHSTKTGQALLAMATNEVGAVDWMEAKPVQRWGIGDVMQERCRYQHVAILGRENLRY
jgi:hypothetical protein